MEKAILCIDDDCNYLSLNKAILELRGYRVFTASNGQAGLDILDVEPIDCVLLDLEMPGMDGNAVAEEIGRRVARPPIILHSGSTRRYEEISKKVDAVVDKPSSTEELLMTIQRVSQSRH